MPSTVPVVAPIVINSDYRSHSMNFWLSMVYGDRIGRVGLPRYRDRTKMHVLHFSDISDISDIYAGRLSAALARQFNANRQARGPLGGRGPPRH